MERTILKDSCDHISSREPKQCSYIDSCSSWSTTQAQWIWQKWMTRFQLTGNRVVESWMDLLPDLEHQPRSNRTCCTMSSWTWSSTSWTCRHCSGDSRTRTTCQCTLDRWACIGGIQATQHRQNDTTEIGLSLRRQLVSIDFCKSGRFDARAEEHTRKYHDTSWKNIRWVQCART